MWVAVESRVDHVGSLLRPRALLEARGRREAGELGPVEFKRIEDEAVRAVVRLRRRPVAGGVRLRGGH
jgi:5-methyltetrahydropteroyltriglutamate--homocysteine methyltransferase